MKKYHFIAIGGAVMHNLALNLATKGYQITGSDDEIYEPARTRLEKVGILPNYAGSMDEADTAVVYLNPHAAALKKLELMDEAILKKDFGRTDLKVFTNCDELEIYLLKKAYTNANLLLMSSGNYDNLDLESLKSKFV